MLLLAPLRLLRLLTVHSRILAHTLFRPRFGSLRMALVLLGIGAMIAYFAHRKNSGQNV